MTPRMTWIHGASTILLGARSLEDGLENTLHPMKVPLHNGHLFFLNLDRFASFNCPEFPPESLFSNSSMLPTETLLQWFPFLVDWPEAIGEQGPVPDLHPFPTRPFYLPAERQGLGLRFFPPS